jgi:hypothetical protein
MSKKIILLIICLFLISGMSLATKAATFDDEILSQIAELRNQIEGLRVQIPKLQTQLVGSVTWCHNFNINLSQGDTGTDVEALQIALQKRGFNINDNEKIDNYFGDSTKSAVVGFQEKYKAEILTPLGLGQGTGFVGESTRSKLNALYGCNFKPESEYKCPDLNGDGKVDILDTAIISLAVGTCQGDAKYDARGDVNGDNCLNATDLNFVSKYISKKLNEISQCPESVRPLVDIFDFSLSLNPSSGKISPGGSVSTTVTSTLSSGTSETVTLSTSSSEPSITFSWIGNSCTPICSRTLIITTSSATPVGTYPITIKGSTTGGLIKTTTFSLTVTTPPCTIAFDKDSYALGETMTINYTNAPDSTILYIRNPSDVNIKSRTASGTGSETYQLSYSDPIGTWDGALLKLAFCNVVDTATVSLPSVIPFDFSLSVSPNSGTVLQGDPIITAVTTTLIRGISEAVTFSISSPEPSINFVWFNNSSNSCAPNCSKNLYIISYLSTPAGTYPITITGTGGGVTKTTTFNLTVTAPPCTVAFDKSVYTLGETMILSYANAPDGTTLAVRNPSVATAQSWTVSGAGSQSYSLKANDPTGAWDGVAVKISPSCNAQTKVTVNPVATKSGPFDFSISSNPNSGIIIQGNSTSASVTSTLISGTSEKVTFSISSPEASITSSWLDNSCTPDCSRALIMTTSSTTPAGTYPITITGTGGGVTKTTTFNLTVTAPPCTVAFDKDNYTIGDTMIVSYTNAPSGSTLAIRDQLVNEKIRWTINGNGSQSYTLANNDPTGVWDTALVKISPSCSAKDTATVNPIIPFSFSLSANPTSGKVGQGSSTLTNISAVLNSGASEKVAFSASGLPSGAYYSFAPTSCYPTCFSVITITTSSTTPAGTYPITITGTGGGVTKTTTFNLTVTAPPCTVAFDKNVYTLGETMILSYTNAPDGTTLAVRNPSVATVQSWTVSGAGSQTYSLKANDPTGAWDGVAVKILPSCNAQTKVTVNPITTRLETEYRCPDLNSDGKIDILDVSIISLSINTCLGNTKYDARGDVNYDNCINSTDLNYVNKYYGKNISEISQCKTSATSTVLERMLASVSSAISQIMEGWKLLER